MKEGRHYSTLTGIVLMSLVGVLLHTIDGIAQLDVTIMINGPWSFVEDPADSRRVVVIAPLSAHHGMAMIFSGEDAKRYGSQRGPLPGRYSLDVSKLSGCGYHPPTSAYLYPATVTPTTIRNVIDYRSRTISTHRYTFSLPKPCYYTAEDTGRSRMGTPPVTKSTPETTSSTWTALHYKVSAIVPATLKGSSDDDLFTYDDHIAFGSNTGGSAHAVSIVLPAPTSGSDPECDSHSYEAFQQTVQLFNATDVDAVFPELSPDGSQKSTYSDNCFGAGYISALARKRNYVDPGTHTEETAGQILVKIELVEAFIDKPTKQDVTVTNGFFKLVDSYLQQGWGDALPPDVKNELKKTKDCLHDLAGLANAAPAEFGNRPAACVKDSLARTEDLVVPFTAGSGDCHGGGLNINGALR